MRWWKSNLLLLGVLLLFALAFAYRDLTDISTPAPSATPQSPGNPPMNKPEVMIGVISRYAPATTYRTYQPLIDILNEESPYQYKLKLSSSYEETVEQLVSGQVSAAFLGSYIYAQARLVYPLKPLVAPLNKQGLAMSRSALIAPRSGPVKSIYDLQGHSLALPSPSSFSSNWLNKHELKKATISPDDLKETECFGYHHTVVFQVLWGNFDAGVVRESVANEYQDQGIQILAYSNPFPSAPLVIKRDTDPRLSESLKKAMLRISKKNTPSAGESFTYGFTEVSDIDYEELSIWIQQTVEKNGR